MRVATWNLDHASNSSRPIDLQIQKILSVAPDIVILTETCDEVDLTTYGYFSQWTERNRYQKYWSVIWSRYSMLRSIRTYDAETAVCAEIATPLGNVIVYGTIITFFGDKGPNGISPHWYEHHKAIKEHGDDWERIHYNEKLPLIVAGDFNQPRDGSKFNRSKDGLNISMLDAELKRNHLKCLTIENFELTGKLDIDPVKGYVRSNIDHICVTDNFFSMETVGAWNHFTTEHVFMSDHNGVYVDLQTTKENDL
jgi:endonuclease/exonuclease/phosphatase family metal-dependent hydrolase